MMTDPNPLREDEVEALARHFAERRIRLVRRHDTPADELEAMLPGAIECVWPEYVDDARAAILRLDQVRENRARAHQQQAYEAQSSLGIIPLSGYPLDQVREGRGK